jgi:hypothetical protein
MSDTPAKAPKNQGEGDYEAARRFDTAEAAFAKSGKVEDAARQAAEALEGPEGEELEAARKATGEGEPHRAGD